MKENNNSYSESEEEKNLDNSRDNDFSLKGKKIIINLDIEEDNNNINENEIEIDNNINLEEIKLELGSRIICPEEDCFRNAIISIEPITFNIKSDCGMHIKTMNILKYVEKTGKAKEEKESCSLCNNTIKDILNNKKNLYKCYCGENVCDTCKNEHLSGKDEKDHNSIDFDKKDFICCCSKNFKKFLVYCIKCKKNICILCNNQHKDHKIIKFSGLYKLNEEEKNKKRQILDEQKEKIEKIKKILDDWMSKIKKLFDIYKTKMDLFWEISNLILNNYDISKNYYEEIKNVENIPYDFDCKLLDLLDSEEDFKKQNEIFLKFLNEHFIDDNKNKKKNEINNNNINVKYNYQFENLFEEKYKEMTVNNICELRKNKLLLVNVSGNKEEELYVYSQSEQNIYNKEEFITVINGGKIISISELENGYVLILQKKYFKIVKIEKEKKSINIIQNKEMEVEIFKQIIQLINGNLVSISYIPNQDNYIIIWEKNLIYGEYERKKINHLNELPLYLMELNNNTFLVYYEQNKLSIFDSKTNEEIKKLAKIKLNNIDITYSSIFNMIRINENIIIFVYRNGFLLYHLLLNEYKAYTLKYKIKDICQIPNEKKSFFINFRKITENASHFGLIPIIYNEFFQKIELGNEILDIHNNEITCIKLLSNNNVITSSLNDSMKIWKINK